MFESSNLAVEIIGLIIGIVLILRFRNKNKIAETIGYIMAGWFGAGVLINIF